MYWGWTNLGYSYKKIPSVLWMVTRVLESIIKYFTSCYKTLHTSNRNKSTYTTFKVPKYLSRFYAKVWRSVNGSFVFFAAIWVVLYDRGKKTRANSRAALFFQHFPLNSRPAKLKKFAKLKDFLLNSRTILSQT